MPIFDKVASYVAFMLAFSINIRNRCLYFDVFGIRIRRIRYCCSNFVWFDYQQNIAIKLNVFLSLYVCFLKIDL